MKPEVISEAVGNIAPEYIQEAGTYEACIKKSKKFPWRRSLAAAAVIFIALVGMFTMPNMSNTFTIKAYARELDDTNTVVLKEIDLLDQPEYWGGYFDGEHYFINMGFRYEGKNIESVTFATQEGFFATQQVNLAAEDTCRLYAGADNDLLICGRDFEIAGNSITLESSVMDENLLLFWGIQASSKESIPKEPTFTATATFKNGKTQEITITLDLSGPSVFVGKRSDEEIQSNLRETAYYESLPLDALTLIEEIPVTDEYKYSLGNGYGILKITENTNFDENGIHYAGIGQTESGVRICLVRRNGDGNLTGCTYLVPENLIYQETDADTGASISVRQIAEYYKNIPLDQCELLEEKKVTDVYEYSIGNKTGSYQIPDELTFDADGNFRLGKVSSGNVVYIPVIHQAVSGDLTGRLYRVPEPLTLQESNSVEPSVSQNTQKETPPAVTESENETEPQVQKVNPSSGSLEGQKTQTDSVTPSSPQLEVNEGSGYTASAGKVDPEVLRKSQEETAYYSDTLSLSDCELLEEKAVTDKFAYTIGPGTHVYKVSELTPFDDKGDCVVGIDSNADGVFLGVLHRDANGSLLGRVYRVPDDLVYENVCG